MLKVRVLAGAAAFALSLSTAPTAFAQDSAGADGSPVWAEAVRVAVHEDAALHSLAPDDIADFCPRYASLDDAGREAFWSDLLIKIAQAESGGVPTRTRWLVFDSAVHRPAFRRGLFQISIEAAHSDRFNCAVASGGELTNPEVNAACAVRIVESTIGSANNVARAGGYWPTLGQAHRRARLATETSAQRPCALNTAE